MLPDLLETSCQFATPRRDDRTQPPPKRTRAIARVVADVLVALAAGLAEVADVARELALAASAAAVSLRRMP